MATPPDLLAAAEAMNAALEAHSYDGQDAQLYGAFQHLAKQSGMAVNTDCYPGTGTMNALRTILEANGQTLANVPIYPWLSAAHGGGQWDGMNAPNITPWAACSDADFAGAAAGTVTIPEITVTADTAKKQESPNYLLWGLVALGVGVASYYGWSYYKKGKR